MRRELLVVGLLLVLVTCVIYWPVRGFDFVNYDDPDYVTANSHVQAGLTPDGLAWAFGELHGTATYYHPLTWVSHMLDCQMFGQNAGAHHLVSLFFHLANVLLVFGFFYRLTGALWRSAALAGLFALHPLQVDSVAWVTERKNLLSTLFWFLTLGAYLAYARTLAWSRYLLALFCFGLGLLAKPVLVTLPGVLLLLDAWPLGRLARLRTRLCPLPNTPAAPTVSLSRLLLEKLPFLALALASCLITLKAHAGLGMLHTDELSLTFLLRLQNAFVSYARYIGKTVWPANLAVLYPHPGEWPALAVLGSVLLLVVISGLAIWKAKRFPYLLLGWLWFLGTLVPAIGLVQVGAQAMADRFAYVPVLGLFLMLVWGASDLLGQWRHRKTALGITAGVALVGCVIITSQQLAFWKSSIDLFTHTVEVTSSNYIAHNNLATALAEAGRLPEAVEQFKVMAQLRPSNPTNYCQVAQLLNKQHLTKEALGYYREALRVQPDMAEVMNNLAWIFATHPDAELRNGAEAVRFAERACELTGRQRVVYLGTLAAAYAEAGRFPEAIKTAQSASELALTKGEKQLAEINRKLLELYQAGKPFRETY